MTRFAYQCLLIAVGLCLGVLAGLGSGITPVAAQNANFQRSYIDPFPKGDRYRIVVLGDSLADGLWSGLYRSFQDDKNLEIVRRSKVSSGLARSDAYDWDKQLQSILKTDDKYQIAVVMFGADDDQPIRVDGKWVKPGTDGWRDAYGKRVEAFLKILRGANIATYWVGLPIMRSDQLNADATVMNDVYREKAFVYGAKFIDTWTGFTDESGHYSAYGPDMTGQMRRLRADDGVQFTMRGYLKLAHFPEKEIRSDLALAKLERNIPLAGSVAEQARVVDHKVAPKPPADANGKHTVPIDGPVNPAAAGTTIADAAAPAAPKLEQSMVGGVELLRPAISQMTLEANEALAPQGPAAAGADNESIASDLSDGLTALSSISAVSDLSVASSKPRLPLTERPYYRVLVKGEQLKPKQGRGDDFRWPPH